MWTSHTNGLNYFISCQDEYSLIHRMSDQELTPAMRKYGLGLLLWFTLASGLLIEKYQRNAIMPSGARLTTTERFANRYLSDRNWKIAEGMNDFAISQGYNLLEMAFSWLLAHVRVASVIGGATRLEQLAAYVQAGHRQLTAEDLAAIDRITA